MELPIAGVDVVEVSPPYDQAEVTAYLGNRIVLEALSGMAWRRRQQAGEVDAPARAIRCCKHRRPWQLSRRADSLRPWCRGSRAPSSSVVLGCRKAKRATVSPSHTVGVTKPVWSASSLADHSS